MVTAGKVEVEVQTDFKPTEVVLLAVLLVEVVVTMVTIIKVKVNQQGMVILKIKVKVMVTMGLVGIMVLITRIVKIREMVISKEVLIAVKVEEEPEGLEDKEEEDSSIIWMSAMMMSMYMKRTPRWLLRSRNLPA